MALTGKQKKHLKALAHHRNAVAMVGDKGLTEEVVQHVTEALEDHELIKVKVAADRDEVKEAAAALVEQTHAHLVQIIGKVVILYKARRKKPGIKLPTA